MQVEAAFPGITTSTLELRMSRSSPGRYSLHDFAKNVYDVHAFGADGREIATTRPDPYGWNVSGHGGAVTVKYKRAAGTKSGQFLQDGTGAPFAIRGTTDAVPYGPFMLLGALAAIVGTS